MNIGKRIKECRLELGMSVDELATKLNKNRATVYRYESDDIENLPITILEPLAKALKTSPQYLMGWTENSGSGDEIIDYYYKTLEEIIRIIETSGFKVVDNDEGSELQIYDINNKEVANINESELVSFYEKIRRKNIDLTPEFIINWISEYSHYSKLSNIYFKSIMAWSEDKILKGYQTTVIRDHFSELLSRYKKLIKNYCNICCSWESDKENFSYFYKNKDNPLPDIEIKELYIKQGLEKDINEISNWSSIFPSFITRNEDKYENDLHSSLINTTCESSDIKVNDEVGKFKDDHLMPIAAHNDDTNDPEQQRLMQEDLDEL